MAAVFTIDIRITVIGVPGRTPAHHQQTSPLFGSALSRFYRE
jgi:hypothetical protein